MNNVPNSDSEQCIESKLSRVHSAPTLGPACVHTACALRRVVGLAWPCHNARPAVLRAVSPCALARCYAWYCWPPRPCRALYRNTTPCRRPLPIRIQILYHDLSPATSALHVVSREMPPVSQPPLSYHSSLLCRIAALATLYRDTTVAPQPRYNVLYCDSLWPGHACVCAAARPTRRPVVSEAISWPHPAVSWPVSAVSWMGPGLSMRAFAPPPSLACHNTVCCIVTQTKKKIGQ